MLRQTEILLEIWAIQKRTLIDHIRRTEINYSSYRDELQKEQVIEALAFWKFIMDHIDTNLGCHEYSPEWKERNEFMQQFLDHSNESLRMVAMLESMPTRLIRKIYYAYNIDYTSPECLLCRLEDWQKKVIEENYQDLSVGILPRAFQVRQHFFSRNLVWKKILDEDFDVMERYKSKRAWNRNLIDLDWGYPLYPDKTSDTKIEIGSLEALIKFLQPKTEEGHNKDNFIINDHDGLYHWGYKFVRSWLILNPNRKVKLGGWVCPGAMLTIISMFIFFIASPVCAATALSLHLINAPLISLPFLIIGSLTPLWCILISIYFILVNLGNTLNFILTKIWNTIPDIIQEATIYVLEAMNTYILHEAEKIGEKVEGWFNAQKEFFIQLALGTFCSILLATCLFFDIFLIKLCTPTIGFIASAMIAISIDIWFIKNNWPNSKKEKFTDYSLGLKIFIMLNIGQVILLAIMNLNQLPIWMTTAIISTLIACIFYAVHFVVNQLAKTGIINPQITEKVIFAAYVIFTLATLTEVGILISNLEMIAWLAFFLGLSLFAGGGLIYYWEYNLNKKHLHAKNIANEVRHLDLSIFSIKESDYLMSLSVEDAKDFLLELTSVLYNFSRLEETGRLIRFIIKNLNQDTPQKIERIIKEFSREYQGTIDYNVMKLFLLYAIVSNENSSEIIARLNQSNKKAEEIKRKTNLLKEFKRKVIELYYFKKALNLVCPKREEGKLNIL